MLTSGWRMNKLGAALRLLTKPSTSERTPVEPLDWFVLDPRGCPGALGRPPPRGVCRRPERSEMQPLSLAVR